MALVRTIWPEASDRWHAPVMGHESQAKAPPTRRAAPFKAPPDLERELLGAVAEIERGEFIELSPEQLERCIADGEWPWPDESPG